MRRQFPAGKWRSGDNGIKVSEVSAVLPGLNPHHAGARKIYDSPHAVAVVITLQPGESLKKHMTPVDVFSYVPEGNGMVEIGSEQKSVAKDTIIEKPARIPHLLINDSRTTFKVSVVKIPKSREETKRL